MDGGRKGRLKQLVLVNVWGFRHVMCLECVSSDLGVSPLIAEHKVRKH